jgi:HEAT repeats
MDFDKFNRQSRSVFAEAIEAAKLPLATLFDLPDRREPWKDEPTQLCNELCGIAIGYPSAISRILKQIVERQDRFRVYLIMVLVGTRNPAAITGLANAVAQHPDPNLRDAIAHVCCRSPFAFEALGNALGDWNPEVRRGAAMILGVHSEEWGTKAVVDLLRSVLYDENARVQEAVIRALTGYGTVIERPFRALLRRYTSLIARIDRLTTSKSSKANEDLKTARKELKACVQQIEAVKLNLIPDEAETEANGA